MPFDNHHWDDLCRAELQSLRNGEEAAMFNHMRARFEVICRRMIDSQPQPSFFSGQPARPFAGPSRSFGARGGRGGRGGYANNASGGRRPEKRHMSQLTEQLKRAKIAESGTAGAGTAGVKSQIVVPRDSVRIVTNDDVTHKMFLIKQNITEHRCATVEELKTHLDGLAENEAVILIVVWKGVINPLDLEAISNAAADKSKFHQLITETEDENSVDVRDVHRKLPTNDVELENLGRSVLKAAQNAGLRPTRTPIQ
ncbi:hypothetical protein AAVH_31347 [Aphelenchoides avenae]|nr:hypothetical protein AAVH_31347 [Aphelenchus avenae]